MKKDQDGFAFGLCPNQRIRISVNQISSAWSDWRAAVIAGISGVWASAATATPASRAAKIKAVIELVFIFLFCVKC